MTARLSRAEIGCRVCGAVARPMEWSRCGLPRRRARHGGMRPRCRNTSVRRCARGTVHKLHRVQYTTLCSVVWRRLQRTLHLHNRAAPAGPTPRVAAWTARCILSRNGSSHTLSSDWFERGLGIVYAVSDIFRLAASGHTIDASELQRPDSSPSASVATQAKPPVRRSLDQITSWRPGLSSLAAFAATSTGHLAPVYN
jgi:hypothetical protein